MHAAGGQRQAWEVELGFVLGKHDRAIRISNANRVGGYAFVNNVGVAGAKVCGTAAIGNGVMIGRETCGGTYRDGR